MMSQHKNELKTAELSFFWNTTPICADLQKNYGMVFGKMVCKFHFRIPHDELQYVPNFQAYITITSA